MKMTDAEKANAALIIVCDLMLGASVYGIDDERLISLVLDTDGFVGRYNLANWVKNNLDRFSDDDEERQVAINRLGF